MNTWRFELEDGSVIRGQGNTEAEAYLQAKAALTQKGGLEQVSPPSKGQVEYAPSERITHPFRGMFRAGAETIAGGLERAAPWTGPFEGPIQTIASLIPRTPESAVLAALPILGKGGVPVTLGQRTFKTPPGIGGTNRLVVDPETGSTLRGMLTYPTVGGIVGATGGTENIAPGVAQGLTMGLASMLARGTERLGERSKEISLRNPTKVAQEEINVARELDRAVAKGTAIPLVGRSASERLIKGSETIQEAASAEYKAMQTAVERGMRRQTLSLPYLGSIRGKEITIPGTPGTPVLGPSGQVVGGAGTPAMTMVDNSFTLPEAFKALKDLRLYVAVKTAKEMKLPQSDLHLIPGHVLRDASTVAREEFTQALRTAGRPDLATEFERVSRFYYTAERHKEALEALRKGGAYKKAGHGLEGGIKPDKALELLYNGKLGDPKDIPEIAASLTKGFPLGVTEVERPGFGHSVGRIYAPRFGVALGTSPRRVPIGQGLTDPASGFPRAVGSLGALSTGNLMLSDPENPGAMAE